MPDCQFHECLARRANPRDSRETLYLEDFKCDFLTLHPYYIYPYYPQKYERLFKEKNPRYIFYNTHTHLLERELLILSEKSLQPLFLPSPIAIPERRFVPKYNLHLFRVQKVFQSLGSFGDLPKEAGKAWWMQSGILRDPESQRRHDFEKSIGSKSLKDSSTLGRLGLEGLLLFVYFNFILQWIDFNLEGRGEIFRQVLLFFLQ